MLLIIGLGLETRDISARALAELKSSDSIFLDTYTAFIPKDYIRFIERQTQKKVVLLDRQALEEYVMRTVSMAKTKTIAILVPGDPLIATTHSIILNEAKKQKIKYKILHAPSVFSVAIGESGLDVYKFGPTVTVPFWSEHYKPTSFIDAIKKNLKNNQHTLLLLDIDQSNKKPMSIEEVIYFLIAADKKAESGLIKANLKMVLLANLGRKDQVVKYLSMAEITPKVEKELKDKVLSLVIPTKMTFAETESLERITRTR